MKTLLIIQDSHVRADLFHWFGPISPTSLTRWLNDNDLNGLPSDLRLLLEQTGGGDFLESETILGPFGDPMMGDAILPVLDESRREGLPPKFIFFHLGIIASAVDLTVGDYVVLDKKTFDVKRRFPSLDDWYSEAIRSELGGRYGLR